MRSIHHKLSLTLIPCFAVLFLAGGAGVYFSVYRSLEQTLDSELIAMVRPIRLFVVGERRPGPGSRPRPGPGHRNRGPRRDPVEAMEGLGKEESGIYYQLWNHHGRIVRKSPSLWRPRI